MNTRDQVAQRRAGWPAAKAFRAHTNIAATSSQGHAAHDAVGELDHRARFAKRSAERRHCRAASVRRSRLRNRWRALERPTESRRRYRRELPRRSGQSGGGACGLLERARHAGSRCARASATRASCFQDTARRRRDGDLRAACFGDFGRDGLGKQEALAGRRSRDRAAWSRCSSFRCPRQPPSCGGCGRD